MRFWRGLHPASPLGHFLWSLRGQSWQAMPQTPTLNGGSEDIVHDYPALAGLDHKVEYLEMLRMLLVALKGLKALEL